MSRYSKTVKRDGRKFLVSWGFDNPLSEYFLHVEQIEPRPPEDDEENGLVFAISNYNTMKCHPDMPGKIRFSNSEIYELMEKWGVEPQHLRSVALDLAF